MELLEEVETVEVEDLLFSRLLSQSVSELLETLDNFEFSFSFFSNSKGRVENLLHSNGDLGKLSHKVKHPTPARTNNSAGTTKENLQANVSVEPVLKIVSKTAGITKNVTPTPASPHPAARPDAVPITEGAKNLVIQTCAGMKDPASKISK